MKNSDISLVQIDIDEKKAWVPRKDYALTLDEIHFIFREFLNNYVDDWQLETKRIVEDIEDLRSWLTNAAISGTRLER